MARTFYLGAYWGPRGEPVQDCAHRLADFLTALGAIDPLLGTWFQTARSRKAALKRPVDPSIEKLQELLLAGRPRLDDEDRTVMSELGYRVDFWNGQDIEIGLGIRCGAPVATPGMASNVLVMHLPTAEGSALTLYRRETALAVVRAVVTVWQPTWCAWSSHALRNAQGAQPGEVVTGWATYVADRDNVQTDRLPSEVTAEPLDDGLLLTADGDADSASEATVLAVRNALGRALRPAS